VVRSTKNKERSRLVGTAKTKTDGITARCQETYHMHGIRDDGRHSSIGSLS
jgi:hypothetical protein